MRKLLKVMLSLLQRFSASGLGKEAAQDRLLTVYATRADLKEVYPEAKSGDLRRLIDWAAGVANQLWKDSSYPELKPYRLWYAANRSGAGRPPAPVPWEAATAGSISAANPLPITFSVMRDQLASDINQHLITLSLLVREFELKQIVELGTRNGSSTLALLEAARSIGGCVLSVDVEPCLEAKKKITEAGLNHIWRFVQAHDLELQPPVLPDSIDLLFIDTSHLYAHTLAELNKYFMYLKNGSWIVMHDYVEFPGVSRAVQEFLESQRGKLAFYPYIHQNGLALLRVES